MMGPRKEKKINDGHFDNLTGRLSATKPQYHSHRTISAHYNVFTLTPGLK